MEFNELLNMLHWSKRYGKKSVSTKLDSWMVELRKRLRLDLTLVKETCWNSQLSKTTWLRMSFSKRTLMK